MRTVWSHKEEWDTSTTGRSLSCPQYFWQMPNTKRLHLWTSVLMQAKKVQDVSCDYWRCRRKKFLRLLNQVSQCDEFASVLSKIYQSYLHHNLKNLLMNIKLQDHVKDREAERAREGMPPLQFSPQMQFLTAFLDHMVTKS